jgi:ferredoxin
MLSIMNKCVGCGICAKNCPVNAITRTDYIAPNHKLASMVIDATKRVKCGLCHSQCRPGAITKE